MQGLASVVELTVQNRELRERVRELEAERRDLRAHLDRLTLVTDAMPSLISYTDADERYRFVNAGYESWFGLPTQSILGRTLREVVGEDAYAVLRDPVRRALGGEALTLDTYLPYRRGGGRFVQATYIPHRSEDGSVLGYCALVHDITASKQTEEALRGADRRKDAFLAMLAHELRNPLSPLRTGIDLLGQVACDPERLAALQATMTRQVNQLIYLVDDLLDVSRIASGKITLRQERLCLSEVVDQALETVRAPIEQARQRLAVTVDADLWVVGDAHRLAQVLSNLLSNASKFADIGGSIELSASAEGAEVVLSVSDDGPGIEDHMLDRIFDRFSQVQAPDDGARGGLGLGLALVRSITEMHGGRVHAESPGLGQGSRFVVRLPATVGARLGVFASSDGARDSEPPPTSARESSDGPTRVLVVDDNQDAALTLSLLLEAEGHYVKTVHDGASALAAAFESLPDVVLLDIGMPDMDGFEVARRIRGTTSGARPVLVALTGWAQKRDRQRTEAAGFDLHVTKPVDPRHVCEVVARARRPRAHARAPRTEADN